MKNSSRQTAYFILGMIFFAFQIFMPGTSWSALASQESNSWFIDMSRFSMAAHGSLSCETCHDDMKENGKAHPDLSDTSVFLGNSVRNYDYTKCKKCHQQAYIRYQKGEHAKALLEEAKAGTAKTVNRKAPTCGDCHDIHYEKAHRTRVEIGTAMTEVCGSCHVPQRMTYLTDFHGKRAVNLSYESAAYCSDCHGAHECVSLKDKKKALMVCQRCHAKAGVKFAEYVVHPTTKGLSKEDLKSKEARIAVIKAVTTIMFIIVIVIVAFFYGHSFLWLLRELHEKLRKH